MGEKLLSFDQVNANGIQSLFASEGYFWLTTALATAFALQEMTAADQTAQEDVVVSLFNQAIREGMDDDILQQAKQRSLDQVREINSWNNKTVVFQEDKSLNISKSFTVYWLMYKLIELEWQEVLGSEEIAETYQFLDGVLADRHELADIEQRLAENSPLEEDQQIFLRSHWSRAKMFWENLQGNLTLLAMGLLNMQVG